MANLTEAERLRGWLLYSRLLEQMEQNVPISIPNAGPDPNAIGKLYFKRSEIFERIIAKMREMAPDGVSSQHQFVEILEQAINTINDELTREYSPDEMADIVLTINAIQNKLMFTRYDSLNLNESRIGMGKEYSWKENLMKIAQDKAKVKGDLNFLKSSDFINSLSEEERKAVLEKTAEEIQKTLDMIYNTLRMIPPELLYKSE